MGVTSETQKTQLLSILHTLLGFVWHLQSTFWYSCLEDFKYWLPTTLLRRYLSIGWCWKISVKFRKHKYRAVKGTDHRLGGSLPSKWQIFQCFPVYKPLPWEDSHIFCLSCPGKSSTTLFLFRNISNSWLTSGLHNTWPGKMVKVSPSYYCQRIMVRHSWLDKDFSHLGSTCWRENFPFTALSLLSNSSTGWKVILPYCLETLEAGIIVPPFSPSHY